MQNHAGIASWIVYQSQCSHCSGNIQELFTNLFSLSFFSLLLFSSFSLLLFSSFSLRKHLCHADRPGIPAPILTTFLCTPAAARARSAQVLRNSPRSMPLSGALHRPIAFSFHKSLLFLVNFFQDDTGCATRISLIISDLGIFRVVKTITLILVK